jgi:hypothetical protein
MRPVIDRRPADVEAHPLGIERLERLERLFAARERVVEG